MFALIAAAMIFTLTACESPNRCQNEANELRKKGNDLIKAFKAYYRVCPNKYNHPEVKKKCSALEMQLPKVGNQYTRDVKQYLARCYEN